MLIRSRYNRLMLKAQAIAMHKLLGGLRQAQNNRDTVRTEQIYFICTYSFIGCLAFALFGLQYLAKDEKPLVGYLELIFALGFLVSGLLVAYTRHIALAKAVMLLVTSSFLMVMLVSGGIQGTGLFWFFVFPVLAFFFTNAKRGLVLALLSVIATSVVWALPDSMVDLPHSDIAIRQLLIVYIVVTVGVFLYQLYRDRTERREKAIDLAKSEFLTLASHQLRTPISAIGWLSELLLSGDMGKLNHEQKEHVEHIYASNQRLASIVDAMLIVSGLELKKLDMRIELVDLVAVSRKQLADQVSLHSDKMLQVSEKYPDQLPKLRLDPRLIKIILQNIFSNALKYTPKNGEVEVSIMQTDQQINPKSKGSILISVRDTGYGISADQQAAVFSKLFRAENIKRHDTDGTGLGLYIVKEVLDEVGGNIWFESEEGKGSTFYVMLPLEGMKRKKKDKKG
jgi:signal transduction histidine kinase